MGKAIDFLDKVRELDINHQGGQSIVICVLYEKKNFSFDLVNQLCLCILHRHNAVCL